MYNKYTYIINNYTTNKIEIFNLEVIIYCLNKITHSLCSTFACVRECVSKRMGVYECVCVCVCVCARMHATV